MRDKRFSSRLTRRGALKTFGLGVAGFGATQVVSAKGQATVEYPKLISGGEVVEYISVPEDWDQHRKHARTVLNRVRESLHQIPSVEETQLEPSSQKYGGISGKKIVTLVSQDEQANTEGVSQASTEKNIEGIPGQKEGIPIETRGMPEKIQGGVNCETETSADNCTNNTPTTNVPGGYSIGDSNTADGTSCCRVMYNGNVRMLTNAHLFGSDGYFDFQAHCNNSESELEASTADVNGTIVGEVTEVNKQEDWALIDDSRGGNYLDYIDDGHGNPTVNGFVSRTTLDIWNSNTSGAPCLANMGRMTGHTTGKIQATDVSSTTICTDFNGEGVKTYCNFAKGDSGSPTYYVTDGDAYLVSLTGYGYNQRAATVCGNSQYSNGGGTGAYHLAKSHGIRFGGNFSV